MLRILLYALPLILAIYALVDLVQTDDEDVQGLPKLVWVALIVLIWIVGPIAWLVAGAQGPAACPARAARRRARPAGPARSIAPDDDPDFLRGLNRPKRPPRGRRARRQSADRSADAGVGVEADQPDVHDEVVEQEGRVAQQAR